MRRLISILLVIIVSPVWLTRLIIQYSSLNFTQILRIEKAAGCVIDPLVWIQCGKNIRLGKSVKISMFSSLLAGANSNIEIGDFTIIGPNCTVVAMNHGTQLNGTPFRYQDWQDNSETSVYIGTNVWIGAGVTILPGTKIGDNCIIAAGALVKGIIPENKLVADKGRITNSKLYDL